MRKPILRMSVLTNGKMYKRFAQMDNSLSKPILLSCANRFALYRFSRHREFEADATAASLVGTDAMSGALHKLMDDSHAGETVAADDPVAAMMISAPPAWTDILSTHPSLERRIEQLKEKR